MPTLLDLVRTLDQLPDGTLFAARPWTAESVAVVLDDAVVELIDDGVQEPPTGPTYLLEVELARDAVRVWSNWRDGAQPTDLEKLAAVVHYAENDAWQPLEPPGG